MNSLIGGLAGEIAEARKHPSGEREATAAASRGWLVVVRFRGPIIINNYG